MPHCTVIRGPGVNLFWLLHFSHLNCFFKTFRGITASLSLSLYLPPSVAHGGAHFSMSSVFCVHSSKNMQFTVVAHTIFKIIIRLHTNKFRAVVRRMHPLLRSSLVEIFEMHWCWFGVPEKLRSANFIFGKRCEIIYWRKFIIIFHMIRFDYSPQLKRTLGFFYQFK